jgi:hypothetical protein
LANEAMIFAVTTRNAKGTLLVNKSISYIKVELLAKYCSGTMLF